ncbi:MAG: hypothetical protein V4565_08480 [Bacteroidota bacterium]
MKTRFLLNSMLLVFIMCLQSCEVIGGIFKAGAATGIIVVVIVIALIIFIISKFRGNNNNRP